MLIHSPQDIYPKGEWFRRATLGMENIVTVIDHEKYKKRRKAFGNLFSNSCIGILEPVVRKHVNMCIQKIKRGLDKGEIVDVLPWIHYLATDTIAEVSFGNSFGILENEKKTSIAHDMSTWVVLGALQGFFPIIGWFKWMATYVPHPGLKRLLNSEYRVKEYIQKAMEDIRNEITNCKDGKTRPTVFSKVLNDTRGSEIKNLETIEEIKNDAFIIAVAGSDSAGTTGTYAIWAIIRNPGVRQKLDAELTTLGLGDNNHHNPSITNEKLRQLPYLELIMQEALRMFGSTQYGLPRTVPGGNGGRQLGPYFLPAGTTVSAPPYTIQRNPDLFPEPHTFKPERWLHATDDMKSASLAFGGASRRCLGEHLAMMELRLLIALFFISCPKVGLADSCTDESMEFDPLVLITPKGHKCELKLY
ncbi:hypothetical protein TWF694_005506 [Orbilia ellipsospora]|uniref:Cytochrome P450 n=1 Tax=Orbilia ellipsospora TaxID=2528407 RepID=A0AAV9WTA8_9PEZI